jgi:predicted CXXCH cytochrome family protein
MMKRERFDIRAPLRLCLVSAIVIVFFGVALAQKKDSCLDCHSQMEGALADSARLMKDDIHRAAGLSCVDCHGGDATVDDPAGAMNPRKGFVGRPRPEAVPAFCGRCHSDAELMKKFNPSMRVDQEREYKTSVHGRLLKGGDKNVATCVSCHSNHGVRAVSDPQSPVYAFNVAETCGKCHANADFMKPYKIPHDQYDKFKASTHAKALYERQDLSAPTCNDCHGNHGAAPPGLASVANVCGQCHARQSDLFKASPHKMVFDAMQSGECVECHSNHAILSPADEMIGVGEKSVCVSCHTEGDNGFKAAGQMRDRIDELMARINGSLEILNRAELRGMEVSRAKFEMSEARDNLTHARVLIHAFSIDEVEKVIKPGLEIADKGYRAGEGALEEWGFRRKGLGVALFFILFLAALIYLKLRQIESRQGAEGSDL